jgi:hypothetical protein
MQIYVAAQSYKYLSYSCTSYALKKASISAGSHRSSSSMSEPTRPLTLMPWGQLRTKPRHSQQHTNSESNK